MEQGLCLVCGIIAVYHVPLERGLYFFAYQDKLARLSVPLAGGLNYSLANQNKLALYHPVSSNYPMWYFALSSLGLYFFAHQDS